MKKEFIKTLLYIGVVFSIVSIYLVIIFDDWIVKFILSIVVVVIVVAYIYFHKKKKNIEKLNTDRLISLASIVIAFIVFIQTSIQIKENNIQSEKQLATSEKQLELSKQYLLDYLNNTKAELVMGNIEITNTNTLSDDSLKLKVTNKLHNDGERTAEKVETRHMIIFNNKTCN